jgi:Zn-dependent M28 family amino/carboxypeptidase
MPRLLLLLAGLLMAFPAAAVTPGQLRSHIDILASDAFEGRAPGTEGESKTTDYIAGQFQRLGLEPAATGGGWLQPVRIVSRSPLTQSSQWRIGRARIELDQEGLIMIGSRARVRVKRAPVVFAGHGAVIPDKGIDQLAGADVKGAVVLILYEGPDVPGFPAYAERVQAAADRGAAAVIGIVADDISWSAILAGFNEGQNRLHEPAPPPIQGAMSQASAARILHLARTPLAALLDAAPGPSFAAVAVPLTATLEVRTQIRTLTTHNVVGRLRGGGATGESLLYLAHWDHLGICRAEGEADRICNGAVDNASGVAVFIEVARALAAGPRPERDILFVATTAEELGLLGAERFATQPPVPIGSIVAAINLDTVAIARKGQKVAVVGRGVAPLDRLIDETAREQGRALDSDREADALLERQDGWALARAGVPSVVVGGFFADMAELGAFLSGPYHQPGDNPGPHLMLDGAAEDADLLIALGRKLADPARYPRVPLR